MSWAWPDGWYPTVGAVAVTKKPISVSRFAGFRYWAHCESCGSETSRDTLLAANAARREHDSEFASMLQAFAAAEAAQCAAGLLFQVRLARGA